MKNRVVEIDDDTVAIEILYKGTQLLCYVSREDLSKVSSIRGTWHINRIIVFACTKPHGDCEYYIIELSNKNILHRIFRAVVCVLNKTI